SGERFVTTNYHVIEVRTPRPRLRSFIINRHHQRQRLLHDGFVFTGGYFDFHESVNNPRRNGFWSNKLLWRELRKRDKFTSKHGSECDSPCECAAVWDNVGVRSVWNVGNELSGDFAEFGHAVLLVWCGSCPRESE